MPNVGRMIGAIVLFTSTLVYGQNLPFQRTVVEAESQQLKNGRWAVDLFLDKALPGKGPGRVVYGKEKTEILIEVLKDGDKKIARTLLNVDAQKEDANQLLRALRNETVGIALDYYTPAAFDYD